MIDPLELPSFSRLGKSTCNAKDRGALEDHRRRAEKDALRTRAPATFRPITEIAPPSSGYDQDRGRSEPITSSPRQVDEADDTEEELQVRRVVRFPGSNAAQDKAKGQTGTGNGRDSLTSSARGDREHQLVPKKAVPQPSYTFNATARGKGAMDVYNKEQGRLAPPPGHYEPSIEAVKPRSGRCGIITPHDKPNAPTFLAETKLRASTILRGSSRGSAKSTSPTRRGPSTEPLSVPARGPPLTPRSAFFILREKEPGPAGSVHGAPTSTAEACTQSAAGARGGDERRPDALPSAPHSTEQVEASEAGASKADGAAGDTGVLSVSAGATQRRNRGPPDASDFFMPRDGLLNPSKAPDFGRSVGRRTADGRPTTTGRLAPTTTPSPDVWYDSMCGVPAAKLLHVPGPDLGRTGGRAERSDQLLRLGYRTPEDLATAPEYPRAIGALEWGAAPAGWAAVKTLGAQATVNYARETGERFRPATSGGAARDAAMRVDYRDGKRGLLENTLCAPDANPLIPHTPGFLMRRAASSHANFSLGRPPTCLGGDYRVSTRLVSLRTAGAPPFRKMLPRRPVTADPRTGKPLSESADIVYNPRYPGDKPARAPDFSRTLGRAPAGHSTAAGGLTGAHYWANVEPLGDISSGIRHKRLPRMALQLGREAPVARDLTRAAMEAAREMDAVPREPMSAAGRAAMSKGSVTVWTPKDNVIKMHTMTPNLGANARARDAEALRKRPPVARDLEYNPRWEATQPKSVSALMGKIPTSKSG